MEAAERYGAYLVYEQIGKGGMATVHRAELPTREGVQHIALKRMVPTMQPELVSLFRDEARVLRYLRHPNIATTFDSGRIFGTYYIAMEYVRGPTLRQLVERCGATDSPVPQAITLELAAQLCDALDHAHNCRDERGAPLQIVHRDVTPANLIISATGQLKLIDFGLAKARVTTQQTAVGTIKGKFGYVAPEYIDGKLDHRADLWAAGIIMYELLTGRRLFDGPDAFETLVRVRELPIPRPSRANPKVTKELDDIVMQALERDPARRWQSAAAMRDRLRAVIAASGEAIDGAAIVEWVRVVFEEITPSSSKPLARHGVVADEEATIISGPPIALVEAHEANQANQPIAGNGGIAAFEPIAPAADTFPWELPSNVWKVCAGGYLVVVLVSLIWSLS